MAANVLLLMSLIANAISSGIIFFSGPPVDLAYLQSNTNVSIYDVEQLSSIEEKALGKMNIFLNFNRRFAPKLMRLIGEHQGAVIIKPYQDICDYQMFRTYVNDSDSEIKNQNEKESFIHLNDSAVDKCGRIIGYQTKNNYFEPSITNMLELTRGSLCVSDRFCFGIKRKDNNASNPLIRKSSNCYDFCTDMCPKGEYLDGCYCYPEYYDWRVHLQSAVNHPGGLLFGWLFMTTAAVIFCSIYLYCSNNDKIKYLYVFLLLLTGFSFSTNFTYYATLNEYGFTTGRCYYYLIWLHLFSPNIPVNRLLTCRHDKISKRSRFLIMFGSLTVSGIFILLQLILLDSTSSNCFSLDFEHVSNQTWPTILFEVHLCLACISTLAGHYVYSGGSQPLDCLLDFVLELVYLIVLSILFKKPGPAFYSRNAVETTYRLSEFLLEMNLGLLREKVGQRAAPTTAEPTIEMN